MNAYWDVLKDALWESFITLPILLLVYYLIEFIEYKWATKLQNNRLLKHHAGPVIAALLGSIPQCGFSVISTDLFAKRMISVGALLAVFIATSDEALPIMVAHPQHIIPLILLIVLKIVIAIVIGYLANGIYSLMFKHHRTVETTVELPAAPQTVTTHNGCCHHHVETKRFDWLHPLLHCLKIFAFIFGINVFFGCLAKIWIGEDHLTDFLSASVIWQPLLAIMVGMIPNCAASVVLSELYLVGGLKFSALLAGLCVNAGLGVIFMFKQNHHWRENLFVIVTLLLTGLAVGYGLIWLVI